MDKLNEKIKALFDSNRIEVTPLNPGYNNTNFVFDVISDEGCYIVKVAKLLDAPDNTFWRGLNSLFDLNREGPIKNQQATTSYINKHGTIKVPKILKADATSNNIIEKPFIILEKMQGDYISQGTELEQHVMQDEHFVFQLGQHIGSLHIGSLHIGSLHIGKQNYFGSLEGKQHSLSHWPQKLQEAIRLLAKSQKALHDKSVQQMLPHYLKEASKLNQVSHP